MPSNEKIYIVFTAHAFKGQICGWLVAVYDCYVYQSMLLDGFYEVYDINDKLKIINESAEDEAEEHRGQIGHDANDADI